MPLTLVGINFFWHSQNLVMNVDSITFGAVAGVVDVVAELQWSAVFYRCAGRRAG